MAQRRPLFDHDGRNVDAVYHRGRTRVFHKPSGARRHRIQDDKDRPAGNLRYEEFCGADRGQIRQLGLMLRARTVSRQARYQKAVVTPGSTWPRPVQSTLSRSRRRPGEPGGTLPAGG